MALDASTKDWRAVSALSSFSQNRYGSLCSPLLPACDPQRALSEGEEREQSGVEGLSRWELEVLFARAPIPPHNLRSGSGATLRQQLLGMLPVLPVGAPDGGVGWKRAAVE